MTTHEQIHREFDRLRGRLLGHIEALTLSDAVEENLKRETKHLSYDAERAVLAVLVER